MIMLPATNGIYPVYEIDDQALNVTEPKGNQGNESRNFKLEVNVNSLFLKQKQK